MRFFIKCTAPKRLGGIGPEPHHFSVEALSRTAAERSGKAECKRQGWRFLDSYTEDEWHAEGVVQLTLSDKVIERIG